MKFLLLSIALTIFATSSAQAQYCRDTRYTQRTVSYFTSNSQTVRSDITDVHGDTYSSQITYNGCNTDMATVKFTSSDGQSFEISYPGLKQLLENDLLEKLFPGKQLKPTAKAVEIDPMEELENKNGEFSK